ncbi:MAG: carboxypeptidase regulatory-like domain-containing protein [Fimbriimonadaceae bacterium]|nr:carboxypeptidase regulatory-like domain-containing protein [Fimbriimonadaceae bacterium]
MSQRLVCGLWLVCLSPLGAALPLPPRNGKNSVQMLVGGSNKVPLCLVPPRARADGTPLAPGTRCTIVVYRSHAAGRTNTYDQEVGRADGQVTRPDDLQPWIDVTAMVPPDDPKGGIFYLASSAIVDGQESTLNNQWLTVRWSPGSFTPLEYPAAGRVAGSPPSHRGAMAAVRPLNYPGWVLEATAGTEFDCRLPSDTTLRVRPTLRISVNGTNASGSVPLAALATEYRKKVPEGSVSLPRNQFRGTVADGLLSGTLELHFVLGGKQDGAPLNERVETTLQVRAALTGKGRLEGVAKGTTVTTRNGQKPVTAQVDWLFGGDPPEGRRRRLAATAFAGQSLGLPGPGFQLPSFAQENCPLGSVGQVFTACFREALKLQKGETRLLRHQPVPYCEADTRWVFKQPPRRVPGDQVRWLCGPPNVLGCSEAGDALTAKAVGNGVGEIWSRSEWSYTNKEGKPENRTLFMTWLVVVGNVAGEAYDRSLGRVKGPGLNPEPGPVNRGKVSGYVRGPDGKPLPGAQVFLVHEATGKTYTAESWLSGANGTYALDLSKESSGLGLKEGSYAVMPYKRGSPNGPGDDYWPHPRTRPTITLTRDLALEKAIQVPEIWLDRVSSLYGR